jgi:hypothetical protein
MKAVAFIFVDSISVKQGTIYLDNLEFSKGYGKPESTGEVKVDRDTKTLLVKNGELYEPYVIKGVGYNPVPIGEYPPHPDDPAIYDRDFPLLVDMGCNTIRTWGTPGTNLMNKAEEYGLKVIAGFWIDHYADFTDPVARDSVKQQFTDIINTHKDSPALLMWALGNQNNYHNGSNEVFYSLCNELAEIAYTLEGASYYPVIIVNGHLFDLGIDEKYSSDMQLNYIDAWGCNVYTNYFHTINWHGDTTSFFEVYKEKSSKPVIITEYGTDAFYTEDPDTLEGYIDEYAQADWVSRNTIEIINASDVCLGGSVVAYSDEWWKDPEGDPGMHDPGGFSTADWGHISPDDYANEEYWGIFSVADNGDSPDIVTPRLLYNSLHKLYTATVIEPVLQYRGHIINDTWFGGGYRVNGNGQFNPGERLKLRIELENIGLLDASDITATLSSTDDYVTILDNDITFSVIRAKDAVLSSDYFLVEAALDTPDNHMVTLALDIQDSELRSWHDEFNIKVIPVIINPKAPVLQHIENQAAAEENLLEFNVEATNSAGAELELFWDARELPQDLQDNLSNATFTKVFDMITRKTVGIFSWRPGRGTVGVYYPVVFVAMDNVGRCAFQEMAITVTPPPEVHYQSHDIIDDWTGGSRWVNGDGQFNPGERVALQIEAVNTGPVAAVGVYAELSLFNPDPYISLIYSKISFPDIPAGGTALSSEYFVIEATPDTPDNHTVTFLLDIMDLDSRLWEYEFDITIMPASAIPEEPVLNSIGDQQVEEWQTLEFNVTAYNSAGTELELFYDIQGLTQDKQDNLSTATFTTAFDELTGETTGTFRWLPDLSTAGEYYPIVFVARDDAGRCAYEAITINVLPKSSDVLLIDDYNGNDNHINNLGHWTGWGPGSYHPDYNPEMFNVEEVYLHKYDDGNKTNKAKMFAYDMSSPENYGWYASNLWDGAYPSTLTDISGFDYLSFRVKSEEGGEDFYIELQYGDNNTEIHSSDYFTVTNEWQQVNIPLSVFPGLNKAEMKAVAFISRIL